MSTDPRTYHQQGRIADEQHNFDQAKQWYLKSLMIAEKQGDEQNAADTYYELGFIAENQSEFIVAKEWYLKSLAIAEKWDNKRLVAMNYLQLGTIAHKQENVTEAVQMYFKSLDITEKHNIDHITAVIYNQLGLVAELLQHDLRQAEQWYLKSLTIKEKQANKLGMAIAYHHLGMVAYEQEEFAQAERWYFKSLAISEKQNHQYGAAKTYFGIGLLKCSQQEWVTAAQWFIKAAIAFNNCHDSHNASGVARNILICCSKAMRSTRMRSGGYGNNLAWSRKSQHWMIIAAMNKPTKGILTMQPLTHRLAMLNEQEAIQLLQSLAYSDIDYLQHAQALAGFSEPLLNPQQQAELARETLAAISEQSPQQAEAIETLLNNPAPQRFDGGITILSFAVVTYLLRTHIRIRRNSERKWEFLIENKPPKDSLIDELIDKLQSLFNK